MATSAQICPRCQAPMERGHLTAWHPESFEPVDGEPSLWERWFGKERGPKAWRCLTCGTFQLDRPPNPVAEEMKNRKRVHATRSMIPWAWVALAGAWLMAFVSDVTEVAVVLGVAGLLAAMVTALLGRRCGYPRVDSVFRAYFYIAVTFLLFTGIRAVSRPAAAERLTVVYALLSAVCVVITGALSYEAWKRPPRMRTVTGVCAGCGYLLYGLTEPVCPECGRQFNPDVLHLAAAPRLPTPTRFK